MKFPTAPSTREQYVVLHHWQPGSDGGSYDGYDEGYDEADASFYSLVNVPSKSTAAYAALFNMTLEDVYDEIAQAFEEARASGALEDGGSCLRYTTPHATVILTENRYQEMDGRPWHFSFESPLPRTGPAPPRRLQPCRRPMPLPAEYRRASPLSEHDRREIYLALCAALPLEEKLHMARVSLVLNESGHTKERYGFQKMKELLRCLTDFLTLDDAVMGRRSPNADHHSRRSRLELSAPPGSHPCQRRKNIPAAAAGNGRHHPAAPKDPCQAEP